MLFILLFPIQVGAIFDSIRASSPTSLNECIFELTNVVIFNDPLYPFAIICTL